MILRLVLMGLFYKATFLSGQILLSHNDYVQKIPLHDAMELGFDIIEADIFLRGEAIVVCHDEDQMKTAPTLIDLYILPLYSYRSKELDGKVLMLDIKKYSPPIIQAIEDLRNNHPDIFDHVSILLSGDIDISFITKSAMYSHLLIDGRLNNIDDKTSSQRMPIISIKITDICNWKGCRRISNSQARKLKTMVDLTHASERKIRFWNVEDTPWAWNVLKALGVDIIGVDNLAKYTTYKSSFTSY